MKADFVVVAVLDLVVVGNFGGPRLGLGFFGFVDFYFDFGAVGLALLVGLDFANIDSCSDMVEVYTFGIADGFVDLLVLVLVGSCSDMGMVFESVVGIEDGFVRFLHVAVLVVLNLYFGCTFVIVVLPILR